MANTPANSASQNPAFQPAYQCVGTSGDRHACVLAALATITSVSLDEVFRSAESLGMPKQGPYYHWLDTPFISALFASFGWSISEWKEFEAVAQLPDLCVALVDYDAEWEVGRHVVVHRAKANQNGTSTPYVLDPSGAGSGSQFLTDLSSFVPSWYFEVQPMKSAKSSGAK